MLRKPLGNLTWSDIEGLALQGIPESTSLEFKARPIGANLEVAKDVCAMANGGGGDIVLGVPELNGIAQMTTPFPNGEAEGNRVVQIVVAGVSPPMPAIASRHISSPTGTGDVVVIRVPRARTPAMVHLQNRTEFWVRRDRQKVLMAHSEIVDRIRAALQDERQLEAFLDDRINEFGGQARGMSLLLAVTPNAPLGTVQIPLREPPVYSILQDTSDDHNSLVWGVPSRPSLDGLEGRLESYVFELHHNGHFEVVHNPLPDAVRGIGVPKGNPTLNGYFLAASIAVIIRRARKVYEVSGVFDPYIITFVLGNSQNTMMPSGPQDVGTVYRRSILKIQLPGYFDDQNDLPARRVCDRLWQAYGQPECGFFDAEHQLMGPGG